MKKVFVFGSLNMDLVIYSPKEVQKGETVVGGGFIANCGGKGANQAVACGKLGADVRLGGCVGDDTFGDSLLKASSQNNVSSDAIRVVANQASGVAVIVVTDGDNRIVLDSGANGKVAQSDVDRLLEKASEGDVFLTQLENPIDIVGYALKKAKERKMLTILNPAPINLSIEQYLQYVDIIVPNENEFYSLTQTDSLNAGRQILQRYGVKNVVVTLGSKGYCYSSDNQITYEDCAKVSVVDTTAAGDTFCGALATKIAEGENVENALRYANKAAALTVTRKGAQQAIPTAAEVNEKFFK